MKEALTLKVNVFIVVQNVFSTKSIQTETSSSKFVPYQPISTNKRDDVISKTVETRLLSVNDLVAVEAPYHISCQTKFENPSSIIK